MEYRRLGSTGLKVSEIGLGGNNFGWKNDEKDSIAVIGPGNNRSSPEAKETE